MEKTATLERSATFPKHGPLMFFLQAREVLSHGYLAPANWWEGVKMRWAPEWFTRRWPLRVHTVRDSERITIRPLAVLAHGKPETRTEICDVTSYEFMQAHGPHLRNEIEIHSCTGEFTLADGEEVVPGAELRIEAPEVGAWWEGEAEVVVGNRVHWRSDGAPQSLPGGCKDDAFPPKNYPRPRFHGFDPQTTLPCSWCHKIKATTVDEVWSIAWPAGHLVRLCKDCAAGCAGG